MFLLFATGVIDIGGKFAVGFVDTGSKLPPVSTTLGKLVAKFAAGVVDTGGKFATGVVDTGGKLLPVSLKPVANLPQVSLIPVANLDLPISPRIFEKILNGPIGILWGWGETDS